jgi:hypothetical protein
MTLAKDTSNIDLLVDFGRHQGRFKKSFYDSGKKSEKYSTFNAGQDANFNFQMTKHFSQSLGKHRLIDAQSGPSSSKGSYFPKEQTSSDNSLKKTSP